jgi:hypothetical protein
VTTVATLLVTALMVVVIAVMLDVTVSAVALPGAWAKT